MLAPSTTACSPQHRQDSPRASEGLHRTSSTKGSVAAASRVECHLPSSRAASRTMRNHLNLHLDRGFQVGDPCHIDSDTMSTVKQVQMTFDRANPRAVVEFSSPCSATSTLRSRRALIRGMPFDGSLPVEAKAPPDCRIRTGSGQGCSSRGCPRPRRARVRRHLDDPAGVGLTGDEPVLRSGRSGATGSSGSRLRLYPADDETSVPCDAGRRGQRVLPRLGLVAGCPSEPR